MNPLALLIPVGLGVGAYLVFKPKTPQYQPPPGNPTQVSGGPRYQSYMEQLQAASLAYDAASLFGKAPPEAVSQFKNTLDVVGQMAQVDQQRGNITGNDYGAIQSSISSLKRKVG